MKDDFILLSYDEAKLLKDTKADWIDSEIDGIYLSRNNEIVSTNSVSLVIIEKEIPEKLKDRVINFDIELKKGCNVIINEKFIELSPEKQTGRYCEKLYPKYDLKFINGKYPNYKSVIPNDEKAYYTIKLDPDYIPKGYYVTMKFQKSNKHAVKCELRKRNESRNTAEYILMPIDPH